MKSGTSKRVIADSSGSGSGSDHRSQSVDASITTKRPIKRIKATDANYQTQPISPDRQALSRKSSDESLTGRIMAGFMSSRSASPVPVTRGVRTTSLPPIGPKTDPPSANSQGKQPVRAVSTVSDLVERSRSTSSDESALRRAIDNSLRHTQAKRSASMSSNGSRGSEVSGIGAAGPSESPVKRQGRSRVRGSIPQPPSASSTRRETHFVARAPTSRPPSANPSRSSSHSKQVPGSGTRHI